MVLRPNCRARTLKPPADERRNSAPAIAIHLGVSPAGRIRYIIAEDDIIWRSPAGCPADAVHEACESSQVSWGQTSQTR